MTLRRCSRTSVSGGGASPRSSSSGALKPAWINPAHRWSGRLAFLCTLPVAYHCIFKLGFQHPDNRVLAHSLLGCAIYGGYAAKVTIEAYGRLKAELKIPETQAKDVQIGQPASIFATRSATTAWPRRRWRRIPRRWAGGSGRTWSSR